jgi:heme-degrading monooxygenase HmoA
MPALPWLERQPIDPQREYVAMASRLPLKSYGSVPGFLRDTMQIRRQLAQTPGLVGYTLNAGLARKTFLTFSVWEDQASLDRFAASDPHRNIIARLRPRMLPTKFEFFPLSGSDLPLTWEQITARLS